MIQRLKIRTTRIGTYEKKKSRLKMSQTIWFDFLNYYFVIIFVLPVQKKKKYYRPAIITYRKIN